MRKRFYGLKKAKLRQSWNKYNLYNFARARTLNTGPLTYFQQKWAAKAATRAYHGETVREKQWQRMFRRSIDSVVAMDAERLARDDGSMQAMGRGSGLERDPTRRPPAQVPRTPYMNMVFAPTERRLDTAVFRALFASSTRQARQFVVHGYVKVNGKKMIYPGYQLNPGDMFQVEPERVLFATGAPKRSKAELERNDASSLASDEAPARQTEGEDEAGDADRATPSESPSPSSEPAAAAAVANVRPALKSLMARAKALLKNPPPELRAKQKQDLREFSRLLRTTLSQHRSTTEPLAPDLDSQLAELTSRLHLSPATSSSSSSSSSPPSSSSNPTPSSPTNDEAAADPLEGLSARERADLAAAIAAADENPYDPSKPYGTPWRPRDWMSPFAFIPRYLEVHQPVCSAVYLRHPVARPGLAEVPTPFNAETSGLAFNWYLRRR